MKTTRSEKSHNRQKGFSGLKNNKGFTLIEMAIVLVIIGLILGAVLKGKDLVDSAKQKNFYSSFVKGWELAVASYSDRTGHILGDGIDNGGTVDPPDGRFDNISDVKAFGKIDTALKEVGLEVPVTNIVNSSQFAIGGSLVQIGLFGSGEGLPHGAVNQFRMTNLPTELAIALDKMIDGTADGEKGRFQRSGEGGDWDLSAEPITVGSYRINL